MPTPIRFVPDSQIPDAELLGFGDLHYDDGSPPRYLSGDPDLAGMVMAYQDHLDPATVAAAPSSPSVVELPPMGPPVAPAPGPNGEDFIPWQPQPVDPNAPGANAYAPRDTFDQAALDSAAMSQLPPDPAAIPDLRAEAAAASAGGAGPAAPAPIPVSAPAPVLPAGDTPPAAPDLMVTQRTGRLDPDVAARQADERQNQNINDQLALQQNRDANFAIERADIRQQRIRIRAEMEEQQRQQQDHQAKLTRFRAEQRQVADSDIATDLVSAQGGFGAVMSVIGAALLGATGSDAGLRMIDKAIDTNVRKQLSRRDTRLRAIADQIGSEEQAVQMAKSKYYAAAAQHAEQLQRLTKSDAYAAATPGVIQELKSKQLAADQAAERESLGKTIETLPTPGKGIDPQMLLKYGELRRARLGSEGIANRAEQEIGLRWNPQTNRYDNEKEVLKAGFQGKGNLEQWIPDFVYSTMGGVTAEGYQVRGAAEALAFATLRQMQPTGPISDADIKRAVKAGALDTEAGLVNGLARIRQQVASDTHHDVAQFGPDVVGEYNRRFDAGGGRDVTRAGAPGETMTATSADIAAELKRRKEKPPETAAPATIDDVRGAVQAQAGKDLPPEGLNILIAQAAHETGDGKRFVGNNFFGHKATGPDKFVEADTTEGAGDQAQTVKAKFRAFDSAEQSVEAHISLLKRRYPKAWEALQSGDENAFVAALHDGGYFTDDEGNYLRGIQRRLGD